MQDLTGVESVEVLKGPQGALFGRNTIGGAINITTKRPTNEFHGQVSASYGRESPIGGNVYGVSGLVSGPLVDDKILVDISVYFNH